MAQCPKCNHEYPSGAAICPACGQVNADLDTIDSPQRGKVPDSADKPPGGSEDVVEPAESPIEASSTPSAAPQDWDTLEFPAEVSPSAKQGDSGAKEKAEQAGDKPADSEKSKTVDISAAATLGMDTVDFDSPSAGTSEKEQASDKGDTAEKSGVPGEPSAFKGGTIADNAAITLDMDTIDIDSPPSDSGSEEQASDQTEEKSEKPNDQRSSKNGTINDYSAATLDLDTIDIDSASPAFTNKSDNGNAADDPADPHDSRTLEIKTVENNAAATLDMDTVVTNPGASDSGRFPTLVYDDEQLRAAEGNRTLGTPGRLKRIWQGAADSSRNIHRTIKGGEPRASDSIFERISPRILVADTIEAIATKAAEERRSRPDNKVKVRQTIAAACSDVARENADYEVTAFLGQGGMGVVLEAKQRTIGRQVAIKMIQPSHGSTRPDSTQAQMKKFFYEAQITGKLDHPNIVPIYELGISNSVLFYSMKKIVGTEWQDVIVGNDTEENLEILIKVSNAMAFAHERHVIHRDLKPENIMLGEFGEVLVTDWGCAVDLSRTEKFSGAGSPPWMAPEMAKNEISLIGPRSDIYLLGAILYQIVSGYPPHPGQDQWQCLRAAWNNEILPVAKRHPLLDIANKAMQTDPDDRFQSVTDFQAAIEEYQQHAESTLLTERSERMLQEAQATQDFETFAKTQFGFQEALELWPDNTAARKGLADSRLAYGQLAFDRGNFDLCTKTLDPSEPTETALYNDAVREKKAGENRAARLKTTRYALFGVLAISVIGLVGFLSVVTAQYTNLQTAYKDVERQKGIAETQKENAVLSAEEARVARIKAEKEEEKAIESAIKAQEEERKATAAAALAKEQKEIADLAAVKAQEEERKAIAAAALAREQKERAELARTEALKAQGEVALTSYQSGVGLALAKVEQDDADTARQTLANLRATMAESVESFAVDVKGPDGEVQRVPFVPDFQNWAWKRVELLINDELLGDRLGDSVTAAAFAEQSNRGVVATTSGTEHALHVVSLQDNRGRASTNLKVPRQVNALAISPDGKEIVYALVEGDREQTIFRWMPDSGQPRAVERAGGRELQRLVVTNREVVAGVNSGVWIWKRQEDWEQSEPKQVSNIRGRILSLQMINENRALTLANRNGQRDIYLFDLNQNTESGLLALNVAGSDMEGEIPSCVAFSNQKIIIGTETGRLFSIQPDTFQTGLGPDFAELGPQQHRSAIRSITPHSDNTLLTTSEEAVVHIWKPSDEPAGWSYDTYLSGSTSVVQTANFMISSNLVLGVGAKGRPIVWDIQRQRQRRRLERLDKDNQPLSYSSPVLQVIPFADSTRATAVHRDGTLDTYDLRSGKSVSLSQGPATSLSGYSRSFPGHSPGASFVDLAVDESADVMVTSARLPNDSVLAAQSVGQDNANDDVQPRWEFCKWQLSTGLLLGRWERESRTEQEISLAEAGSLILYASDEKTVMGSTTTEYDKYKFEQAPGSYFGVQHPRDNNLVMLVKRSGAVRLFDTSSLRVAAELADDTKDVYLADDEVPLVGAWSAIGNRFYIVWSTGRMTEFSWENGRLDLTRDVGQSELSELGIQWSRGQGVRASEDQPNIVSLNSHHDLDLKIRSDGPANLLYLAVRFPGSDGTTLLTQVKFPMGPGKVTATQKTAQLEKLRLVLSDAPQVSVSTDFLRQVPAGLTSIVASTSVGQHTYAATKNGSIYRVNQEGQTQVFGRPELMLSASGNRAGNTIVTLHENGTLWRADFAEDVWTWRPLKATQTEATQVAMSPDGTRLLISLPPAKGMLVLDAESGDQLHNLASYSCGVWDGQLDSTVALIKSSGLVELWDTTGQERARIGKIEASDTICSVQYFRERWQTGDPARWLVVHCRGSNGDALRFVNLHPDLPVECGPLEFSGSVAMIACSPVDNTIAVGGDGSLRIFFANPTLKESGKELFSLEGHGQAGFTMLRFAPDGQTLISADEQNRLFGWLSNDELSGFGNLPAAFKQQVH